MKTKNNELGVGLVEVLVALVLLAVGVLGYTALQLRAVDASNEALTRSQATVILRGLTESMRVNNKGQKSYAKAVQDQVGMTENPPAIAKNCLNAECKPDEMASYDAYQAARSAINFNINITMSTCPGAVGSSTRQCLFAAWDKTAKLITATDYSACMDSEGIYVSNARCLMMEAY